MKIIMRLQCLLLVVGLSKAEEDYENKLTKLWSLSSASNSDGSAVVNVTSTSILIQPSSYSNEQYVPARASRVTKLPYSFKEYAFKPRAIPLRRSDHQPIDKNIYYNDVNKFKSEVLFPGNYVPIAKEKSNKNSTDEYNPMKGGAFHPKAIPLMREEAFEKRSLNADEEPIIEKPEGFVETAASRRSISDILGVEEEVEDLGEEEEEEEEDVEEKGHGGHKGSKSKRKGGGKKQLTKYMLPLLLAYKLKYFALVPLMIGGLVLLVGATGLAGFFFALFAAVMGLQKGGY